MSSSNNSGASLSQEDLTRLRIQINNYDSYQSKPSFLDIYQDQVVQVPIIRVFGTLQSGHHVTVHIHNAFPYLLVDYFGDLTSEAIQQNKANLLHELEHKLKLSFQRRKAAAEDECSDLDPDEEVDTPEIDGRSSSKRKYIADISLCKAVPFYGYHVGYKVYYKISVLSSSYKTRLARLLAEGDIFNRALTTYEAHIPFFLQFLSDFNLYGCGWLNLSKCYWRYPVVDSARIYMVNDSLKKFMQHNLKKDNVLRHEDYSRTTNSMLEIDSSINFIENRKELVQRNIHHNFIENLNPETAMKRENYISSLSHLVKDVKYQTKLRGRSMSDKLDSSLSEERTFESTDWMAQKELDSLFKYCVSKSKSQYVTTKETKESFVKVPKIVESMPTVFDDIDNFSKLLDNVPVDPNDLLAWKTFDEVWLHSSYNDYTDGFSLLEDTKRGIIIKNLLPTHNKTLNDETAPKNKDELFDKTLTSDSDSESDHLIEEDNAQDDLKIQSDDGKIKDKVDQDQSFDLDIFQLTQRQMKTSRNRVVDIVEPNESYCHQDVSSELMKQYHSLFNVENGKVLAEYAVQPILPNEIMDSFEDWGMLKIDYPDPTYSNPKNLTKPFLYAGKKIALGTSASEYLKWVEIALGKGGKEKVSERIKESLSKNIVISKSHKHTFSTWEYVMEPPSFQDIDNWMKTEQKNDQRKELFASQIEAVTQSNDFKYSYNSQKVKRRADNFQNLTCFGVEIHVNTRGILQPDPEKDEINSIFYNFDDSNSLYGKMESLQLGVLILSEASSNFDEQISKMQKLLPGKPNIEVFETELQMVDRLLFLIQLFDPDILAAYELHATSWGYLIERFRFIHDIDLCINLSRTNCKTNTKFGDRWGYTHASGIKITGRHCLNIWRILKSDLALTNYSIENVVYHTMHEKLPSYTHKKLTSYYKSKQFSKKMLAIKYYLRRIILDFKIIQNQEVITRNTEQARLIGIDFYSIFYRGSQYKVESILTRLTKAENLVMISPTKKQVHQMRSLECIPLIMEPESAFYKSPLVVLDFQSLYPSIVIAFNYCYSTILGKLRGFSPKVSKVGFTKIKLEKGLLEVLEDDVTLSPNGYMFVKKTVRKSILAKMLEEILDTRIKVKNSMKMFSDDGELAKLYNSKQLALKLIANVTYGYTSATFSGRMPNSDIADAIVSTGREILTKSINVIEQGNWGAKVVYGDTDSLFVYLPGKTREESFRIGKEMADNITRLFPNPVKLKFEKVYHPCVLLSKKRYVGYSYEHENQQEPKFDAKGIETVRRDGIPAQQKILEKSLRILFEKKDISQIKSYVSAQFYKVMTGKVSIKDFCFAKEVRIGTYKNEKYLPAGAVVAMKKMEKDGRSEPQYRERVPYLVVQGRQGELLRNRSVPPEVFLGEKSRKELRLDHEYYITKMLIPPLERVFNLMGINIKNWYKEMPKIVRYTNDSNRWPKNKRGTDTLTGYIKSNSCVICYAEMTNQTNSLYFCSGCVLDELQSILILSERFKQAEVKLKEFDNECHSCFLHNYGEVRFYKDCTNHGCLTYYNRIKAKNELRTMNHKLKPALDSLNW